MDELRPEPTQELSDLQPKGLSSSQWLLFSFIVALFVVTGITIAVLAMLWGAPLPASLDASWSSQFQTPAPTAEQEGEVFPSPSPQASLAPRVLPVSKTLTGGTHTFQTFNNCGPSALSMTLSYYGIHETQKVLGDQLRPYQNARGDNDDKSVTLQELAAKAQEYGFETYRRPNGNMEILEAFIAEDIPVITRTWLKVGEDIGHFRVVRGYNQTNRTLIQDDSLQGKDRVYTFDEFNELWSAFNYEFLVLIPKEKHAVAMGILGKLSDEKQAWNESLSLAESQLSQDPDNLYAGFNKSVALYELGRYHESTLAYESVASRLPRRMLWYQLEPILAYYKQQNYNKVLEISDAILNDQNRAYSELHYLKGRIFEQRGDAAAATQAFADAQKYNGSSYWKINVASIQ